MDKGNSESPSSSQSCGTAPKNFSVIPLKSHRNLQSRFPCLYGWRIQYDNEQFVYSKWGQIKCPSSRELVGYTWVWDSTHSAGTTRDSCMLFWSQRKLTQHSVRCLWCRLTQGIPVRCGGWGGCELVRVLWKTVWQDLLKPKTQYLVAHRSTPDVLPRNSYICTCRELCKNAQGSTVAVGSGNRTSDRRRDRWG